jgi:DNA-binding NarL/FixJ family response regulator
MQFLVVDDDLWSRDGMYRSLSEFFPDVKVLQARSVGEATSALEQADDIRLILLDLNLEDCKGIETLVKVKQWCEDHQRTPRIVVVSAAADFDETVLSDAIENCATGFITKGTTADVFKAAIDLTLAGSVYITERYLRLNRNKPAPSGEEVLFTDREKEVAVCLVRGLSYKEIARQLALPGQEMSDNTVRVHVQRMAWKLKAVDLALKDLSAKSTVVTAFADERWKPHLKRLTRRS